MWWSRDEALQYQHERFVQYEKTIPEMIAPWDESARACIGGFGALGQSSSFHAPFVLELRELVAVVVFQILAEYEALCLEESEPMHYIALMPDRLSIRYKGTKTSAESVHRDNCPGLKCFDRVFGSFLNLDLPGNKPQQFNCINGSHLLSTDELKAMQSRKGFATITDKEEKKAAKRLMTTHDILSGHLILFHAHMLHEVKAKTADHTSRRAYNGFQFTTRSKVLHKRNDVVKDPEQAFAHQGILQLPSGQMPPMYAKMHRNQYLHKVVDSLGDTLPNLSTKTFTSVCLERHTGTWEPTPEKPLEYTLVKRFCPSLDEQDALYPAMSTRQQSCLIPARKFVFELTSSETDKWLRQVCGMSEEGGTFKIELPMGEEDSETETDDEAREYHAEQELKQQKRNKASRARKRRKLEQEQAQPEEQDGEEEEEQGNELPHKQRKHPDGELDVE